MTIALDAETVQNEVSADTAAAKTAQATIDAAELTSKATALRELIRANANQTEADRKVTQPVIDALDEAGLFKLAQPRRLGGYELPIRDFVEITSIIAQGDASAGWVATLTNVCAWIVGTFPDQAQRDVWGDDENARVCGVVAPTSTTEWAEGGLRVTGKWGFASGSLHAQWAVLGIPVIDENGAQIDQGLALIPLSDLSIEDTWYVAGMRGSGSNTLVADDVFVPAHRILSVSRGINGDYPTEHTEEALYRSAMVPVLALVLAGPLVGAAQAALDLVLGSLAKGKGISYTFYERASDSGSTQINIAEAAILVDSAYLHLYRAADAIDAAAAEGVYPSRLERARSRMDTGYIARLTRQAVDLLLSVQGAGSFAEVSPLQRIWRDLNTGSRHAVINPSISAEAFGRELLGLSEQVTPLV
ncbi:acyl-CoA dehydrogenase family protein [Subtercola lobariae]|uniref:Acyl-CoA dehydrogenase n=1 Tax=Subtercola lobariae TaxID=1588641 RepID=A0A917BB03_9MICO|nr:acyl-CoA dehydrogenase family protein [Subtercola lobariae]GGF29131.1 acyl-CoA dehydrogenase [Subtercola lobariae]